MKTFDLNTLETIYFKGILPCVTYCISFSMGLFNSLQDLEYLHIYAIRVIHNTRRSVSVYLGVVVLRV